MRSYLLTPKERTLIESFIETQDIPDEAYNHYCQIRHQWRKHKDTIKEDLELLNKFMETSK